MALGSISSLGAGSNFDLQSILDRLRAVEEVSITRMEKKKADIEVRLAEFDAVKAKFLTMKSHALYLSLQSNFLTRNSSVANENVLTTTVALGTAETTSTVEVARLASKSSFQSSGVADANAAVITTDSTFAYKLGIGGDTISVSVPTGTTLNQLSTLINDDKNNPGITASVINDGTGSTSFRLVLTAKNTGEDQRISIVTPLDDLPLTEIQGNGTSLNAEIKIEGITYERQQNTGINDVLQDITLNLKTVGTTTVQVTADTSSIQSNIVGLVGVFNDVVQEINTNSAYNEQTGEFGPLASSSLRGVVGELSTLLGTRLSTDGTVKSLYDLGLALNRDGSITLDEDVLATALSSNAEDVMKLFVGDDTSGITGLGNLLNDRLYGITGATGLIANEKEASSRSLSRLESQTEIAKARLDRRFEILARQFVALDTFVSQIKSQADFLTNMISNFSNNK